jgi:NADH dehydrogenase
LGGGFGGAYCAQALEKTLRGIHAEVLLMDRHNFFAFDPLLVEAGCGILEPRHVLVSLRRFLSSTIFRMAEVLAVDTEQCQVTYRVSGSDWTETVSYDHLVVSLGSTTQLPPVPGLKDYGFTLKHLADAMALRDRAIQMLELAEATPQAQRRRALLHFVVVGGSFTGVEVAGQFLIFLRQASQWYPSLRPEDCAVTLIQRSDRLLPPLDADLAAHAADHLKRLGVQLRLQTSAVEVGAHYVQLDKGERLGSYTVIWCAGIAPNPLLQDLPFPRDQQGYLLCEPDLRVQGLDNVWAIGDCAVNRDPEGQVYPATAQHAVRQGDHLARNLARVLRGQPAQPCHIRSPGQLAALGRYAVVAKIKGFKFARFPAWFLWRSVYLMKMPGWTQKLRVALDWSIELFFTPSFVQLDVSRLTSSQPEALDSEAPEESG